ncbi:hypothetical protein [Peptostreptococcus sp. D1]|uniref:hypothetical protein n=1 Tax=Peptostreptococcus sp. D1 TaxID=72304 RepID=UPI0008E282BF|nr:hypothetical protein [Peptostreptococcus sp. D1]SFE19731.1 hypothetical protein SAMN02910278_00213 [Peptostreptococcus sp. D1]
MEKQQEYFEFDFSKRILSEEEAHGASKIQREFLESYVDSKDKIHVEEWLLQELKKQLPERTSEEIHEMSSEIITSLKITEEMKVSQQKAFASGRSKESWFASTVLQSTSYMSEWESARYLQNLDNAVKIANTAMNEAITTKGSGYTIPSKNPNLDGFIAEQHHVNSFNMDAATKGSGLRAGVQALKPGETYTKNGFDVVIKDANGKRIHQYQMKYGATAEDTIRMLKSGNYNNQTIVVPAEQVESVQKYFPNKTVTSTIGDGDVKSNPLTKEQAKELQKQAQKGNFMDADWNDYVAKDIALGISKQTGYVCLQGAAVGAGMAVATKIWNGESIDGEEVVESAIDSGVDFGVKTATAAALKVASEKGVLKAIPKGTKGSTFANIAFVAIENVKVLGKVATGELTAKEGIDAMQQTTGACVAGLAASMGGAEIGASIGAVLGPVGAAVGGFAGGTIGYMAGSKAGKAVVKGVQKVSDNAVEIVKSVGSAVVGGIKSVARGFASLFGF